MLLNFEERPSDSPFVERVWRSHSETSGTFISLAVSHWEMAITRYHGTMSLTLRGPETSASAVPCPEGGEWLGIRFKLDTFMPHLPASRLLNSTINLPLATSKSFWLHGSAWQFPDFENADTFINRLVRAGLLVHEPVVVAALQGQVADLSLRSAQRRFLKATGLTHTTVRQIERARYATFLLRQGVSILDTIEEAGYFDQPHLSRSLKLYTGQTPAQLLTKNKIEQQLSFLYKTKPPL